jgi:hypothetical protein
MSDKPSAANDQAVHKLLDCLGDKLTKGTLSSASPEGASLKRTIGALLDACEKDEDDEIKRSAKAARVALECKMGNPAEKDATRRADRSKDKTRRDFEWAVQEMIQSLQRHPDEAAMCMGSNHIMTRAYDALHQVRHYLQFIIKVDLKRKDAAYKLVDRIAYVEDEKLLARRKGKEYRTKPDLEMNEGLMVLLEKKGAQLYDELIRLLFETTD